MTRYTAPQGRFAALRASGLGEALYVAAMVTAATEMHQRGGYGRTWLALAITTLAANRLARWERGAAQ